MEEIMGGDIKVVRRQRLWQGRTKMSVEAFHYQIVFCGDQVKTESEKKNLELTVKEMVLWKAVKRNFRP